MYTFAQLGLVHKTMARWRHIVKVKCAVRPLEVAAVFNFKWREITQDKGSMLEAE